MSLILDAHIVIWKLLDHPLLTPEIRGLLSRQTDPIHFSLAQLWEVEIKIASGRMPRVSDFSTEIAAHGLELVLVEPADVVRAARLPLHHRDPFDRMLIAQALARGLTIITHDRAFAPYAVPIVWA
jgi:PIN domain nuclease of toxin-antitoxin system